MLYFRCENTKQRNALEGLAYHIADLEYIKERQGLDFPELEKVQKTIELAFSDLDRLQVPFWVQNAVVTFAENWRRYKEEYIDCWLRNNRNIELRPASYMD